MRLRQPEPWHPGSPARVLKYRCGVCFQTRLTPATMLVSDGGCNAGARNVSPTSCDHAECLPRSSIESFYGCARYVHHSRVPSSREPSTPSVREAVSCLSAHLNGTTHPQTVRPDRNQLLCRTSTGLLAICHACRCSVLPGDVPLHLKWVAWDGLSRMAPALMLSMILAISLRMDLGTHPHRILCSCM